MVNKVPPEYPLGTILTAATIKGWGGTYWKSVGARIALMDSKDRGWTALANDRTRFKLTYMADGTKAPSTLDRELTEGEVVPGDDLEEYWIAFTDFFNEGYYAYRHPSKPIVAIYSPIAGTYRIHFPNVKAERGAVNKLNPDYVYLHSNEFFEVTVCSRCNGWFDNIRNNGQGCYIHKWCSVCFQKYSHIHCGGCTRVLNDTPHCGECNTCFRCTSICQYCDFDDGVEYCRRCCQGEHYEETDEPNNGRYIRPYTDRSYPPARPPMPTSRIKCEDCKGTGLTYTPDTRRNIFCPKCHGLGIIENPANPIGLWMGVELEVEVPKGLNAAARAICTAYSKDVILKNDATIRHGFEIVTAPLSIEEHLRLWDRLAPDIVSFGCRSWKHTNTGLHIHTNRSFYSTQDICKLNVFINNPSVKEQVVKIAGRESVYAALKPKTMEDGLYPRGDGHREALNLHNDKTIELRIFKGTCALEHIKADLMFMHAVAHWIKIATSDQLDKWGVFWKYVLEKKDQYPDLVEHYTRKIEIERLKEEMV